MKTIHLHIISPEEELFHGDVESVSLPGMIGMFTLLPHHAPIVSSLKAGTLSYVTENGEVHKQEINGGFIEMTDNNVSVCVE